jgi:hypothetical protein
LPLTTISSFLKCKARSLPRRREHLYLSRL